MAAVELSVFGLGSMVDITTGTLALTGVVGFTVVFEMAAHRLEHHLAGTPYMGMLAKIYKGICVCALSPHWGCREPSGIHVWCWQLSSERRRVFGGWTEMENTRLLKHTCGQGYNRGIVFFFNFILQWFRVHSRERPPLFVCVIKLSGCSDLAV